MGKGCLDPLQGNDNLLTSIEPGVLEPLNNLGSINANDNKLDTLNPHSFYGNKRLRSLDCIQNKFTMIKPDPFMILNNLEELNFERNYILDSTKKALNDALKKINPDITIKFSHKK